MELSKGEVRKLNVVYFLSRDGRVEQPHLIRVHHLNRSGVRLRDVKRWLSELRGREMPDSFAWSYKRRYKSGYIWQDLLEGDLITPISDNEFVLKGCELPRPLHEEAQKDYVREEEEGKVPETVEIEADDEVSPPRPDDDSPGESTRRTAIFRIDISKEQEEEDKKKKKNKRKEEEVEREGAAATATRKSRQTLQVFRSILTCRSSVETNDAALMPTDRRESSRESSSSGGKGTRKAGEKGGAAAYRPVGAPHCSQCGKAFKPEKLHSHMKSCKALVRSRGQNNTNLGRDGSKKNLIQK
ncbi:protein SOSEKI 1 [Typha angustifolia]|uniref:protein SOSEKI 1 n=1 Tax=Typha angustifolia TaxID=59011 RepID=UPI003C2B7F9A